MTSDKWSFRLCRDTSGQDLIEYGLLAGFVAVAAGVILPGVSSQISDIVLKISDALALAGS